MHVHFNQSNPNIQLDALYAAAKAEANREAARTRKKLSEFASKLSGRIGWRRRCYRKLGTSRSIPGTRPEPESSRPIGNAEGSRDFKGATSRVSVV